MTTTGETVKRIILLSDGTGNSAAQVWRTNVWRLYQALDLTNGRQVGLYDDGVGSSMFKPFAVLGGALGFGLKRNVLDLYRFVCRNWPNPSGNPAGVDVRGEIFGFGFSRGAFTIRVLMALIASQGLVPVTSERQLRRDAAAAYRDYRRRYKGNRLVTLLRSARDQALKTLDRRRDRPAYDKRKNRDVPSIRFMGLWDSVAAYGLPIAEMTRGVNMWLWPLSLPDRELSPKVCRACHALALDDERTTFHPVLWTERGEKVFDNVRDARISDERISNVRHERLSQVWFTGMHSNVGGGYPDDGLAHVPLHWMMEEAAACGLEFKGGLDAIRAARLAADQDGRLYDSRHGLSGYYRYGPRKLANLIKDPDHDVVVTLPKIHVSVFERIKQGGRSYAPIGLPERYAVVDADGNIVEGAAAHETSAQAHARAMQQEHVWDVVWRRRVNYFATLLPSLYLALFPWIHGSEAMSGRLGYLSSLAGFLSGPIRALGAILPGMASRWIESFAANPGFFLVGAGILALLIRRGSGLENRLRDEMRAIWRSHRATGTLPDSRIYRLRTHPRYLGFFHAMRRQIVPTFFVIVLVILALAGLNRVLFAVGSSLGFGCTASDKVQRVDQPRTFEPFRTNALCAATGLSLEANTRYRITIEALDTWKDGSIPVKDLAGFRGWSVEGWGTKTIMLAATPWRRSWSAPWFRPFARIGATGNDTHALRRTTLAGSNETRQLVSELTPKASGELFLYVNDAVIGLPRLAGHFYGNNKGTAKVTVEPINK